MICFHSVFGKVDLFLMLDFVYSAHNMLGETLSGLAIIGLIVALFARDPRGGARRATAAFLRLFAIVLSVQWLLGIINFIGVRQLGSMVSWTHPIIMTIVVALAHIVSGRVRKSPDFGYVPVVVLTALMAAAILFGIGRFGVNVF